MFHGPIADGLSLSGTPCVDEGRTNIFFFCSIFNVTGFKN